MDKLLDSIADIMASACAVSPSAHLLVALSGGADSVALLCILRELGYAVSAAHCNFCLRGDESRYDETFCRKLCEKINVPLHVIEFNTHAEADARGESIEMAARHLRYSWFKQLKAEHGYDAVAIAHHRDDNIETLLLNLVRGTGIRGLCGMTYRRDCFIRPLLGVSHNEILFFLKTRRQDYVTDSSNTDVHFKRNFIRHHIIPLLEMLNPSVRRTLSTNMSHFAAAAEAYDRLGREGLSEATTINGRLFCVDLSRLDCMAHFEALARSYGLPNESITRLEHWQTANERATFMSDAYLGVVRGHYLEICHRPPIFSPVILPSDGELALPDGRLLTIRCMVRADLPAIPREKNRVALDEEKIHGRLTYRTTWPADRFHPFGLKGTKLVSDYLTDRHVSLPLRQWARVIADDKGILWLIGERPDTRAAITPNTRRVILIEFHENVSMSPSDPT